MDQVLRGIPHIFSINRKFTKRLEWRSWFSSKSMLPNMSLLFKPDGKDDCLPDKDDSFKLLLNNQLIKKKDDYNHIRIAVSLNDPLKPCRTQFVEKQFSRYDFYDKFIECIDKKNFDLKSEEFRNLINNLSTSLHLLNAEQLITIIGCLYMIPEKSNLTSKLDEECCKRSTKWGKNTYLKAAWSFFQLNKTYNHAYLQRKIVLDLADEVLQMTPQELVMYLTILKQFRKFPKTVKKIHIEHRLSEVLDSLSIEDLGLVCLAFFECNEAIENLELVGRLVERLLISASSANDKTVGSMLKLFRRSSSDPGNYAKQVLDIQPILYNLVPNWNVKVLIQLIAVGSSLLFYHAATIERVIQKFLACMEEARLKDLERLSMAIAMSTHNSPITGVFWDALGKEFTKEERKSEISQYPHSFISLTNYAVIANHYSEQLLQIALSPDFVEKSKNYAEKFKYSTKREMLSIDCSVSIERPEYCGPRLSTNDAKEFEKLYRKPMPNINDRSMLSNYDAFLVSLLDTIRDILGGNNRASLVYLQPHFTTPDIVFNVDGREMKETFASSKDSCGVQRCVLVGGSRNMYSRFTDQPMGPLRMKIRQLEKMGYQNIILISWNEFLNVNQRNRLALLKSKICEVIKRKN